MALQSSGAISLANIQTEMGGVNPIGINEYYGWDSGIPVSGTISMSHFYGQERPNGTLEYASAGTFYWDVPLGVFSVTICMIGGGGGGAQNYVDQRYGGGYSGGIINQAVAVTPGETITVIVGGGGARGGYTDGNGGYGGASSFKGIVGAGGKGGGITVKAYAGNGASRSTCMGTFYDGIRCTTDFWFGGQAGFANGGKGSDHLATCGAATNGARGSGGGGSDSRGSLSGIGGTGVVNIVWG